MLPPALDRALDQNWRIFATGLSFVVFGLGTLLLTVSLFPLLWLWSRDADERRLRFQHTYHRGCRFFIGFMKAVGVITYEVQGVEHLRGSGRLVLANHPSLVDAVFFLAWMPEATCIVKQALWRNPFLSWAVVAAGHIGNASPEGLIEDCAASLRAGRTLIIFPEGTRSVPGQPLQFKRGAARIALAAGAPIVPVQIRCEPVMLTKHLKWYQVPERTTHYAFTVGAPLSVARSTTAAGESAAQAARRLTLELQTLLTPVSPAVHAAFPAS